MTDEKKGTNWQAIAGFTAVGVTLLVVLLGAAYWAGNVANNEEQTPKLLQAEIVDARHQSEAADRDFQHQLDAVKDQVSDLKSSTVADISDLTAGQQEILILVKGLEVKADQLLEIQTQVNANTQEIIKIKAVLPAE